MDARTKLYQKQHTVKVAIEGIEKAILDREHRTSSLQDQKNRLDCLWKEFQDNHETIINVHGTKDDIYFQANTYKEVEKLVETLHTEIGKQLALRAEEMANLKVSTTKTQKVEVASVSGAQGPHRKEMLQTIEEKSNSLDTENVRRSLMNALQQLEDKEVIQKSTEAEEIMFEFLTATQKLRRNLVNGLAQEEKQVLERERISWQKQMDMIEQFYLKLRFEHKVRTSELLEEKDEIEERHREADIEMMKKLQKLTEVKKSVKLAEIKIPLFSGNIEEWPSFRDLYKKMVHESTEISNTEKMYYLKSLMRHDALATIKHLPVSEKNYESAWEILNQRFNNERILFQSLIDKILDQPQMNSSKAFSVRTLLDTTNECMQALIAMNVGIEYADSVITRIVMRKIDKEGLLAYEQNTKRSKEIQVLDDVLQFLEQLYQSLEAANNQKQQNSTHNNYKQAARKVSLMTGTNNCLYCKKGGHATGVCRNFLALSVDDRNSWVKTAKICFKCLKHPFGNKNKCESQESCNNCGRAHHSSLHKHSMVATCVNEKKDVLLATAQVRVKNKHGEYVMLKALIDQGSQTTFISEEAAQILQTPRVKINTELHGIGNVLVGVAKSKIKMEILPRFESRHKFVADALVLPALASVHPDKTVKINMKEWQKYILADPNFNRSERIDIVIGGDLYVDILQAGIKKKNGMLGQHSKLGLIMSGPLRVKQPVKHRSTNMTTSLEKFWEMEEVQGIRNPHEDEVCMTQYEVTTSKDEEGRFIVRLPFKPEYDLGNSYKQAMARFINLEKKLETKEELKTEYIKFMEEYESLGHMEEVTSKGEAKYYLPHQAVVREASLTTKIRVVFDASATTTNGKSLNDVLNVGPRLQMDVFDILVKFRLSRNVITADVEKMYRQIKMHKADQAYQHILWRTDKRYPLREYKLTTVTYGTASAPFLAVRTLVEIANECPIKKIANIIKEDFYMDDLLTGADTVKECRSIKEEISKHLERYGFHLRKWCSNNEEIVNSTESAGCNDIIDIDDNDSVKTLGLQWNPKKDDFRFKINPASSSTITKRLALSYLAKIFDPLGLLTPITVTAKLFIQQLWVMEIEWDVKLDENLSKGWQKIVEDLSAVEEIKIPRWVNTTPKGDFTLLGFADASEKAYSAVVYLKSSSGVALLAAKSKVNPIKNRKTLPKLELCAAQLLARLCYRLTGILKMNPEIQAWSDSTITLSWLNNNRSKDKFVRSRVDDITKLMPNAKWHYVKSKENPADMGSRGISSEKLKESSLWWNGPSWLQKTENEWPKCCPQTILVSVTTSGDPMNFLSELAQKYSSFRKLKRVVGYVLRFIKKLQGVKCPAYLTKEELKGAEYHIIRCHQETNWHTELIELRRKEQLNHRHKLATLHPYLDEDGIMRVGGRLHNSELTYDQKHPKIIHKSTLADAIIADAHKQTLHGGSRLVETVIRRNYWILNAKRNVKSYIRKCAVCTRYKQETKQQLMGSLPGYRVSVSAPFDHCGVDYAGPLQIKYSNGRGQRAFKGYVAVFVCMATKAVHLEAVSSLTTEAFLAALKRFFARRGKSSHIYSDNGTNFIGAAKRLDQEFAKAIQQNTTLAPILEEQQIKWHFIPPASPHFGGIWEAAVKSMKHHLKRVVGETKLTFEELCTLLYQIEAIMNSRPMYSFDNDVEDIEVLTPGHFLIGRPMIACPEPIADEKIGCLDRWKLMQKLKTHFWSRWKNDYLSSLQQRHRWKTPHDNLQKGQVVIIKSEETHPARWPLGKVIDVHPGSDGLVRAVTVKTSQGEIKRPVQKLCQLERAMDDDKVQRSRGANRVRKQSGGSSGTLGVHHILCLLLMLGLGLSAQAATNNGTTINEISNSTGIYLDHIGSVDVISSTWNMVVYFNLNPFFDILSKADQILTAMRKTCGNWQTFEGQCTNLLDTMDRQVINMKNTNQYIFPQNSRRAKRAPLEFIGSLQHILFGTMDADDRRHMEENMVNILDNQHDLKFLIKKQTSVVESTVNVLRRTTEEVNNNFRSLTERVNNITEAMKESYFLYRESIKFFMVIKELHVIIEENEKVQAEMIELLIDINHGKLNPALITPVQLQDEVNNIRERIAENLKLPGRKYDQLRAIYKLLTAKATIIESQLVISTSIPLLDDHVSQLHKIIPIPFEHGSRRMVARPRSHYLIYNFDMNAYHLMSQSDLNNCQKLDDEEFVCSGGWPWIDANDNSCEVSSLKPLNSHICQFDETTVELLWTKLHAPNNWLFKTFNKSIAHIMCKPNRQKILELPLQGIMSLEVGCTLRVQGATMTAPNTVESRRQTEQKMVLTTDIARMSGFNMLPMGSMEVNHSTQILDIMKELHDIKAENIKLRGLNFHHVSGHTSLILVLVICVVVIIYAIRKYIRLRALDSLHFGPRQNVNT